jgi:hypothetical protein
MEELWQYTWLLPYAAVAAAAWLIGAWKGYWRGYWEGCLADRQAARDYVDAERVRRGGPVRYVRH